jgi:hypothetical protein
MVSKSDPKDGEDYFNATHAVAFVISNSVFNKIGLDNLESVVEDRKNYYKLFQDIGI